MWKCHSRFRLSTTVFRSLSGGGTAERLVMVILRVLQGGAGYELGRRAMVWRSSVLVLLGLQRLEAAGNVSNHVA